MTALVLLDHEGGQIRKAALSAVTAATRLGDVHVLVAGDAALAQAASQIAGVSKVLHAADARYAHELAEPLAALLVSLLAATTISWPLRVPRARTCCRVQLPCWTCSPSPMW